MILVTGGTGRTGRGVVDALRADGRQVRVLTRSQSNMAAHWTDVDCVVGDLGDNGSLESAMAGISDVFLLSPMDPSLDKMEALAYAAATKAGVGFVLKMSTTTPAEDSPIPWWRAHWRSEQALRASGLRWTILRPNGITFFLLEHAASIRNEGVLRTAGGEGRMALVDASDIAAVAARVFADPDRWLGQTLNLTGPTALSYGDVAAIASELTGRPIRHVDITPQQAYDRFIEMGWSTWEAEGITANFAMTRDGSGGFDRLSGDVERVLGRAPLGVENFLRHNLDGFLPA